MIFRKTRTHFQGASNRPQTHLTKTHQLFSPNNQRTHPPPLSPHKNPFASFASKSSKNFNFTQTDQPMASNLMGQQSNSIEGLLKRKFKNSKNIVKLLDHWGVNSSGFLTRQQFKQKIQKVIGKELNSEEVENLLVRHSESTEYIDSNGLISLLLGSFDGIPIDAIHMPASQNSYWRQQLTSNLKEDLKNYQPSEKAELNSDTINTLVTKINRGVNKMRKNSSGYLISQKSEFFRSLKSTTTFSDFEKQLVEQIERGVNFKEMQRLMQSHKNADYLLVDPILRKIKPSEKEQPAPTDLLQTMECKMKSLPNLLTRVITNKEKRGPFDPLSLLNQDQRKTRFDRSGFTFESSGWNPNCTTQSVEPDQKQKIMQTLQSQAQFRQTRYQNKLNIMKANREKEQQNVSVREELNGQREKSRLERIRDQQQAYNYINFIKKRWE